MTEYIPGNVQTPLMGIDLRNGADVDATVPTYVDTPTPPTTYVLHLGVHELSLIHI